MIIKLKKYRNNKVERKFSKIMSVDKSLRTNIHKIIKLLTLYRKDKIMKIKIKIKTC